MDFLSMEPVTIPCSELIPGYHKLKGEGSHNISFDNLFFISWRHTDFTFLIPCIKELNAKDVIDIFEKWIKPTVGLPYEIITDQDVLFMSVTFQDWAKTVGVRHEAFSEYHPQTDGASERKNKTIIPMFATKKWEDGTNWVQVAPSVQIEVNTSISGSRGKSAWHILLGFDPKLGSTPLPIPIPIFSNPAKRFYKAAEYLTKAKIQQTQQAYKRRRASPAYPIGSQVMLSIKILPARYNSSKLSPKLMGPFNVNKELTFTQNVELDVSENPDLSNICPVFTIYLIKPFFPNPISFTGRQNTNLGNVDEKENRYEVERVMEYRSQPGTGLPQHKVRWKGYDYHQNE